MDELQQTVLELARLGLKGDVPSVRRFARKLLRKPPADLGTDEDFREALTRLVVRDSSATRLARSVPQVDIGSDLAPAPVSRIDHIDLESSPILEARVAESVKHLISERAAVKRLAEVGIEPTRSVLLTGPPGVGKTMTAHYLAQQLDLPLVTLELSALMSSYLGKSAQNLRNALLHGQVEPCVLFLDEFDALGKRRDDPSDIGELKRIVNVLLLELDAWSSGGLLVAATNHPELLDRAVWRRFDVVLELSLPSSDARRTLIRELFSRANLDLDEAGLDDITVATMGSSHADVKRTFLKAFRKSVIDNTQHPVRSIVESALEDILRRNSGSDARLAYCQVSQKLGRSQREIGRRLGVSHVTVGKLLREARD